MSRWEDNQLGRRQGGSTRREEDERQSKWMHQGRHAVQNAMDIRDPVSFENRSGHVHTYGPVGSVYNVVERKLDDPERQTSSKAFT